MVYCLLVLCILSLVTSSISLMLTHMIKCVFISSDKPHFWLCYFVDSIGWDIVKILEAVLILNIRRICISEVKSHDMNDPST